MLHPLENLFGMTAMGRDGNGGDDGALPDVLVLDFGNGDIEPGA